MIVRHWFPVILGGLTLGLAAVCIVVLGSRDDLRLNAVPAETIDEHAPPLAESEYQGAVRNIVTQYEADGDARAAHDQLIYITRIPGSMKDAHIALVAAFGKLMAGQKEDGENRLAAAKLQYSWLSM